MIPTVPWMRQKFAEYNQKYFGGQLPTPQFAVEGLSGLWGAYDLDARYNLRTLKITKVNGNGKITLTNRYSRDENAVISTLLHEMCHEYVYLVMGICPQNKHGKEFMSIAQRINADGWKISSETIRTDTDTEGKNQQYDAAILCIIKKPEGTDYKWWICKCEKGNIQQFNSTAKKIDGVSSVAFYEVDCPELEHVKSDPSTLFGWGGMSYLDAITRMAEYCGTSPTDFYGSNLRQIKAG